ncbi:helix-turn-helix domain-containing protein [Paracoccus sp. JM45]|uniref:helix-turn-helix domain-containing protein n=1 Tax=Paracoccus sp. JM45 TaxID=2283626 RepID=UPI000E6BA322|nr:helix-turn-helix domain-containing protein [Paracoccus sp. JM45]RJE78597.1 hypothetical protein DWB67_16750 [Paracoccus sp. JM45]
MDDLSDAAIWRRAQGDQAATLACAAGRLGALDERLRHAGQGARQHLALAEADRMCWYLGDRVSLDKLALWVAMRVRTIGADGRALERGGWAVRRLSGGIGPDAGLAAFLGRHVTAEEDADGLAARLSGWQDAVDQSLHPIVASCMGYHLWNLAGLGQNDNRLEAAVTAARIAVGPARGAVFAPLAGARANALWSGGDVALRLAAWIDAIDSGAMAAIAFLDRIRDWQDRAAQAMAGLSGRTPTLLRQVVADWPLVSAPMGESLTGASRSAVQRNLDLMQDRGLVREMTGQGRFRCWCATL